MFALIFDMTRMSVEGSFFLALFAYIYTHENHVRNIIVKHMWRVLRYDILRVQLGSLHTEMPTSNIRI